jgi:hypothetical protein
MKNKERLDSLEDWVQELANEITGVEQKVQRLDNKEAGEVMKYRWEQNVLHDSVVALRNDVDLILEYLKNPPVVDVREDYEPEEGRGC